MDKSESQIIVKRLVDIFENETLFDERQKSFYRLKAGLMESRDLIRKALAYYSAVSHAFSNDQRNDLSEAYIEKRRLIYEKQRVLDPSEKEVTIFLTYYC
jgi:hypothetical protein